MSKGILVLVLLLAASPIALGAAQSLEKGSLRGTLLDVSGRPLAGARVELRSPATGRALSAVTDASGAFSFPDLPSGSYSLRVEASGKTARAREPIAVSGGAHLSFVLALSTDERSLTVRAGGPSDTEASGGERLTGQEVAALPLNKRDFSQLLLLAAGTMTDTNGAANFTQQFAVNGQRGTTTVFSMDGADTTDPEMGGATFSNFNVDAIQEVQSSSGVMPAEIGHGAAGYTNIVTKSGTASLHGSVFEFVRNAAFDARNFFDRRSIASPGRIPPFVRNEFGFTLGGPLGHGAGSRTFFFGQYQGFRQVLGTTQILSVPTAAERQGLDTTAFPGDTLTVPVNPEIAGILAHYPAPNDPQGPYGARTFATMSKVATTTNQFSIRIDHRFSDKTSMFGRFSLNNVTGPLTNPNQTAIDPSFAIRFFDHQRNFALHVTRALSSRLTWDSSIGFVRSTPFFPAINHTQPALLFGDGLYEPFNSADGQILGAFGNLYQLRQDFSFVRGKHAFKWGGEIRVNRDATIFGTNPSGAYSFGGGTAYSPVAIPSASGQHNIQPGDALPDALTGLLTATPFSYTVSLVSSLAAQGDRFDEAAVRREAYNIYFQDSWKATPRLSVNYGLRFEYNTPIKEAMHRTSAPVFVGPDGGPAPYWEPGVYQKFVVNVQPSYRPDWTGFGPRLAIDFAATDRTTLHAGGAITTIIPNLWQDNFATGGIPFSFSPYVTALPNAPIAFQNTVQEFILPPVYTPSGQLVYPTGNTKAVAPNTPIDLQRFQQDLAALTPGHQVVPLSVFGILPGFRNGYIGTYTAGLEHHAGDVTFRAAYVATVGVHLGSIIAPNSYAGAAPAFAPFTQFDASGNVVGGFGPEFNMSSRSHSTYHALQAEVEKTSARYGLGFQASYTFSKSLDDTSSVLGGLFTGAGPVLQTMAQNPRNLGAEKGPSTFDVTHVFTLSLIEALPMERTALARAVSRKLASGWQVLSITTLTSGSPFSVYSGIQQTGAGAAGADRPDQVGVPDFSTSRNVREDYFGRGADNASLFYIPIGVLGGTGPNQGRPGTLGRNTFRGPAFHNIDFSIIKDTTFGRRGSAEAATLEFRAEFFNVFNLVNFGLPSNIVRGSGFGIINRTAGPSRQIQFSLKLIY